MTEKVEETPRNLRAFGLGLGAILGFFAFLAWRKGAAAFPGLGGLALLFALAAGAAPMALRPVFRLWMRVVGVIAAVNTFLITAVVFYLMITPYALVARLLGKDLLDEKLGNAESYWHDREPRKDPQAYERQF